MRKDELIEKLDLKPLPREGGYFRFITGYGNGAGAIYYMIDENQFSHLHCLSEDELWLFIEGDAVEQTTVSADGTVSRVVLDSSNRTNLVPKDHFQATRIRKAICGYALFCTMMSPRYRDDMYTHGSDIEKIRSIKEISDLI